MRKKGSVLREMINILGGGSAIAFAEEIRVGKRSVYNWILTGEIPPRDALRIGKSRKFGARYPPEKIRPDIKDWGIYDIDA